MALYAYGIHTIPNHTIGKLDSDLDSDYKTAEESDTHTHTHIHIGHFQKIPTIRV